MLWDGYWPPASEAQLLRNKYPDLKEKWIAYKDLGKDLLYADKELTSFGIIKRFFKSEEYNCAVDNYVKIKTIYKKAEEEYDVLEKLLKDY